MAYDRYDTRRERWQDERRDRDERGFFERAGDEIASWFGDDEAERRRRHDEGREQMERNRGDDRDRFASRSREPDRNRGRDEDRGSSRPMNWTSSERDYRSSAPRSARDYERLGYAGQDHDYSARGGFGGQSNPDYMSPTGPSFGYGGTFGAGSSGGYGSGGFGGSYGGSGRDRDRERGGFDRSESPWGRDDYRNTSYAGSDRHHDRHYAAWRQRQLDELDRDYEDFHRENQSRFEQEFGRWREGRQQKRGLLGHVREHMEVVGSDGETIGKVDKVRGDHIVLTRSDSSDNRHHAIRCTMVDSVEGDQVRLDVPAEEAKSRWTEVEGRSSRSEEETNLNRSFAGTYDE